MPPKSKKIPRKAAAASKPGASVPAYTQLKAHRVQLSNHACAINVPLGNIVHWHKLITRPIVTHDVLSKMRAMVEKNGWVDSYNMYGRLLSPGDRDELRGIIKEMRSENGGVELEGHSTWLQARLQFKVSTQTRTHTRTHTHTHTHTDTHTHTHTYTGAC
jgi:hypothetical protein